MKNIRLYPFIFTIFVLLVPACSVEETVNLPEPENPQDGGQSQIVNIGSLTIEVIDEQGLPVPGAIIGSIPTLNPIQTVEQTPTDAKERQLTLTRFITDESGFYTFNNITFNVLQSPLIFNAYDKDETTQMVYFGSTFVDLEADQDEVKVTVQLIGQAAINADVKIALFDPEPFPRAIDFFSREGIYFDNLIYDQYHLGGAHEWQDWDNSTWDAVLNLENLSNYDVVVIGFDASKYVQFDLLVRYQQTFIDFIKNNNDKLLFLAQQNHASFTWSWLADFDVPQEGLNGGFLTTLYDTAHLEDGILTPSGHSHPIFASTALASELDADNNSVADVWEKWTHIEPNKPQIKEMVAWHAGNSEVFGQYGWDILVAGPASEDYFNLPKSSGVITAIKPFANGSRIFFSDATYYQASYGPQKSASAIILKDRLVSYLATWPDLRRD